MPADTSAARSPARGGDTFTAGKLSWLEAVGLHVGLSTTAYRLAIRLSLFHLNRTTGFARVGYPYLAKALGVTERAVMRAVLDLESSGFLNVRRFPGREKANEYTLAKVVTKGDEGVTFSKDEKPDADVTFSSGKPDDRNNENVTTVTGKGDDRDREKVTRMSPQPIEYKPSDKPSGGTHSSAAISSDADGDHASRSAAAAASALPTEAGGVIDGELLGPMDQEEFFEAIWARWPKHSHRQKAEAAFVRALMQGVHLEDIGRHDPVAFERFTINLATWLDDRRWTDAPNPSAMQIANHIVDDTEIDARRAAVRSSLPF